MKTAVRESILAPYFGTGDYGDVRYFSGLPLEVLEELIANGFVDLGEWNTCPGVSTLFLPFLKRNPEFTAHGYVVSWDRDDTRITVEGVEHGDVLTKQTLIDFANTFRDADEVVINPCYAYCWYD